jgi:hypothetical protein
MAQPTATQTSGQPFAKGSIIWRKYGPLPVWAWALIVLGVVLAWSVWRRNKAADENTEAELAYVDELPGDQTAGPIFIVPQLPAPNVGPINVTAPISTVPTAPPGGGRPAPPGGQPVPKPIPKPVPQSPGRWVTVTKYPDRTPPKESTLFDIAAHYLGNGNLWGRIWNDPRNAQLKAKRGKPENIREKDRFFVPGAR